MTIKPSRRMARIPRARSSFLRVEIRKEKYKDKVIDFISGWTDSYMDDEIQSNLILDAINLSKYAPSSGIPELKSLVVSIESKKTGYLYEPSNVIITNGATGSLHLLSQCLFNEEDEVIVLSPYWLLYPSIFNLSCKLVPVKVVSDIVKFINSKTKAILINTPSFCDGRVLTELELKLVAEIAINNNLYVISDEVSDYAYYGKGSLPRLPYVPKLQDLLIIINAASKIYNAGGWRVGYCVSSSLDIISEMNWLQINSTYGASTLSQEAYLRILKFPYIKVEETKRRRDLTVELINKFICAYQLPLGGTGIFPKVSQFYNKLGVNGSEEFAWHMFENASVGVGPGIDCGDDERIYINYCLPEEQIRLGIERIKNGVS